MLNKSIYLPAYSPTKLKKKCAIITNFGKKNTNQNCVCFLTSWSEFFNDVCILNHQYWNLILVFKLKYMNWKPNLKRNLVKSKNSKDDLWIFEFEMKLAFEVDNCEFYSKARDTIMLWKLDILHAWILHCILGSKTNLIR